MSETNQISYFSPGPAKLPEEVLVSLQKELVHYKDTHVSVLELSHRSKDFGEILNDTIQLVRDLLKVPDNYKVLFMQGGGHGQFAAVPFNLIGKTGKADYIVTGTWSSKAAIEAAKYGDINLVLPKTKKYTGILPQSEWKLSSDASYVYYCANETFEGVEFQDIPNISSDIPLVCDMSSNFFSRPVDISKFGLIYGGAQKNIGGAGVAVVIVREDLMGKAHPMCPALFDYALMAKNNSLLNTPPSFAIHVVGQVLGWIKKYDGVEAMERLSIEKSNMVYGVVDGSDAFYVNPVEKRSRSRMNVTFRIGGSTGDEDLEVKFTSEAAKRGLLSLKGHRSVGGIRVSLYNAITVKDTTRLVEFMKEFQSQNKK